MAATGHLGLVKTLPGFTVDASAALTGQKSPPFFDTKKGQEKDRDILVHPFQARRQKTTGGAHLGVVLKINGFWLDSCNEKKHKQNPNQRDRKGMSL